MLPGFTWYGDAVERAAVRAAEEAAKAIVDDAIEDAKANTPVDEGDARDSVHREGDPLDLVWGYFVEHGFYIEVGANGRPGVYALRRADDANMGRLPGAIASRFR